jgi:hypothetical protein
MSAEEAVEMAIDYWEGLTDEIGFDLAGVFRRRRLVPFVFFPRHIAARHGAPEKTSIYQSLQQAHDAFIFGVPFAALALMRSIMETVLRDHYNAQGNDLSERICTVSARSSASAVFLNLRACSLRYLSASAPKVRVIACSRSRRFSSTGFVPLATARLMSIVFSRASASDRSG